MAQAFERLPLSSEQLWVFLDLLHAKHPLVDTPYHNYRNSCSWSYSIFSDAPTPLEKQAAHLTYQSRGKQRRHRCQARRYLASLGIFHIHLLHQLCLAQRWLAAFLQIPQKGTSTTYDWHPCRHHLRVETVESLRWRETSAISNPRQRWREVRSPCWRLSVSCRREEPSGRLGCLTNPSNRLKSWWHRCFCGEFREMSFLLCIIIYPWSSSSPENWRLVLE